MDALALGCGCRSDSLWRRDIRASRGSQLAFGTAEAELLSGAYAEFSASVGLLPARAAQCCASVEERVGLRPAGSPTTAKLRRAGSKRRPATARASSRVTPSIKAVRRSR